MSYWLRVLDSLIEDLGLFTSTHIRRLTMDCSLLALPGAPSKHTIKTKVNIFKTYKNNIYYIRNKLHSKFPTHVLCAVSKPIAAAIHCDLYSTSVVEQILYVSYR